MKIAILTQPLHNNYGGNLQNFALQKVLKDMGHEPVTIDRHHPIKLRAKLRLGYFKRLVFHYLKGQPKPSFKAYFSNKHLATKREEITRFIGTYITKTPRLYSDVAVQKAFAQGKFDAVVVGSDQCWRPMYSPNIYSYFLDFLSQNNGIKKMAYAASFGTDEWEYTAEQTERCKQLTQQFGKITVREKAAVGLVKEKLNADAEFVLDPTLLLNKEDYQQLFNCLSLPANKGIYTYILDSSDWKQQIVETAKSTLSLPQYSNQHNEQTLEEQKIPSIEGWIKGFADADFVITDSFHGTVFSIIFNKPFISLVNINRGASRFESILSEFDLLDRLVGEFDKKQVEDLLDSSIDYGTVQEKLQSLRGHSFELLKAGLKNGKK
ncbi:polysaccharide pyruvyl transferase family protein [Pseudidiomarina woesei]|uniref:Polysaccharide pyruvyl transferase n=1 Tax=Pseudidiomarina woesei TaxID=1381080 RepID=A0A0K6H5Z9_9GAMM|nr:polysaccharide pyruvyl transferase family protein [Pseudidiomarina woesei]CUA86420.1 Polysaccharide pyruvyl transferase [Pseudidiomarina woesei]